jgi:myo-inositol 2-dehydrogenase / D-chiro-inositol 1-dehydrogenase
MEHARVIVDTRDRPARIGVIGAGAMGSCHARLLANDVSGAELAAVADVDVDRANALARELGAPQTHRDGRELIAAPEVEAVIVASTPDTHEALVRACLDAGKPVLCEKPLAASADAGRRIVEAEAATGSRLVRLGFMRRYDEGYRELKRRLDNGDIGAPLLVHCVHRNADIPDSFDQRAAITDSVVHEVDVTRWLLGEEIASVAVVAGRATRHAPDGVRDPQVVLLETESGVLVDVESFLRARYGYDVRCEVVGEMGTLALPEPRAIASGFEDRFAQAYRDQLRAWVSDLHDGTASGPSAWDGYAAGAVTEACLRAARTGQRVAVGLG